MLRWESLQRTPLFLMKSYRSLFMLDDCQYFPLITSIKNTPRSQKKNKVLAALVPVLSINCCVDLKMETI